MDDTSLIYGDESFRLFVYEDTDVEREQETVPDLSFTNIISSNNMESNIKIKREEISDSNIQKSLKTYSKGTLSPSVHKAVNEQTAKNGYKCKSFDREMNSTNQQMGKSDFAEKFPLELQMPDKNDSDNQMGLEFIQNSDATKINMEELKMDFENSTFLKTLPVKKRRTTSQPSMTVQERKPETLSFAVTSVTNSPGPLKIISANLSSDSGIGNEELKTESDKPVKKRKRTSKSSSLSQFDAKSEMSLATSETRSPTLNVKSSSENKILSNDISSSNKKCKKQSQAKVKKPKIRNSVKKKVDSIKMESRVFPRSQLNVFKSDRKQKSAQSQLSTSKTKLPCKTINQNSSESKSLKDDIKDVTELQLSVDLSKCQSLKSVSDMHKEESVSKSVPLQYLENDLPSCEVIKNVHSSLEKTLEYDNAKESFSSGTVFENERRKSLRVCSKEFRYGNFEYTDMVKRAKRTQKMEDNKVISENCKLNGIKYPNTMQQNKRISKRKSDPSLDEIQNTKCKKKEMEFHNIVSSQTSSGENSPIKINYTTAITKTRMLTRKLSKSMLGNKTEHSGNKSNEMQFLNSIQRDILNIEKTQPFVSLIDCNKNPPIIQPNTGERELSVIEEVSTPIKLNDVLKSGVSCEEKEICNNENIHVDEKSNIGIENPDMQTFLPCNNKLKDKNKVCSINTLATNKLNELSKGKLSAEAIIENDINSVKTKVSLNNAQSPKISDRKPAVGNNSKTFQETVIKNDINSVKTEVSQNSVHSPEIADRKQSVRSNSKTFVEAVVENDNNLAETEVSQNSIHSSKIANRKRALRSNSKTFQKNVKVSSKSEELQLGEPSKDAVKHKVTTNSKKNFAVKLGLNSSSNKAFEESKLVPSRAEHRKRSRKGQTPSISAEIEVPEGKGKSSSNFLHVKEDKFTADSSASVHKQLSLMDMVKRYSLSSKTNSVDSPWSPKIFHNSPIVNKKQSVRRKNKTCSSFHSSPSTEQNKLEQTSSVAKCVKKSKANVNKLQKIIKSNSVKAKNNSRTSSEVSNTQQTQYKVLSEDPLAGILKKKATNYMSPIKNNNGKSKLTNVQETSSAAASKILPAEKKSRTTHSKDSLASIKAPKNLKNKIGTATDKKVVFDVPQVKQTFKNNDASILNSASVPQIIQNVDNNVPVLNSVPVSHIMQATQNNTIPIMNSAPVSQIMQGTGNNNIPIYSVSGNFNTPEVMNIFGNCSAGSSNLLVPVALPTNFYSPLNAVIPYYPQIAPHSSKPYVIVPPAIQFQNNSDSYLLPALPARFVSDAEVQVSTSECIAKSFEDNCIRENVTFWHEQQFNCPQTFPNASDNKYVTESPSTRLEGPVEEHSTTNLQSSSLLFSDFLHFVNNVACEIKNNSVMTSKFHAEEWFEENSFSRNMTVRQFCTNSKLMKTLSGQFYQKGDEYNDVSLAVQYKFPDGFEDLEFLNVLKDYINFHLKAIQDYFSINTLPFSSESIISYVYSVLSFREGMYMSCLLRKSCSELEIKDLLPCFLLSGLMVIYNEFSERVQEQYVGSNVNS